MRSLNGQVEALILLTLLALLFWVVQRGRPGLYLHFWRVGWLLTVVSYGLWALPGPGRAKEAVRVAISEAGLVAFLLSFVVTRVGLRRSLQRTIPVAVVACALVSLFFFVAAPHWVLELSTLAVFVAALWAGAAAVPKEWPKRRMALAASAFVLAVLILMLPRRATAHDFGCWADALMRAGLSLGCAILFAGEIAPTTLAGATGLIGFGGWTLFYLVNTWREVHHLDVKGLQRFWNFPKYFVGLAMVLKVYEDMRVEAVQRAEQYRDLYEDFRELFEESPHPKWIYDPETQRLMSSNAAAVAMYGYTKEEFLGMKLENLNAPLCEAGVEAGEAGGFLLETPDGQQARHMHKDGSERWVELVDRGTSFQGRQARFLMARDITEGKRLNEELLHHAQHDALTGLPNRLLFASRLKQRMAASAAQGKKMAVMAVDIDHFKQVNDTYGHRVGDQCLVEVASRLRANLREADMIARTGGEEFMAVVGGLHSMDEARSVAETLRGLFERGLVCEEVELALTISIGVAVFPDHGTEEDVLRDKSDRALYSAKRNGRNRVEFAPETAGV